MAKTEKDIKELLGDEFEYLSEEKKGKKWHIKVLHKETNSELVCRKDKWSIDVFLKRYSVKEIKKTALKYGYEFLRIIEMCERGLRCEFRCLSCGLKREGMIGRLEEKIKNGCNGCDIVEMYGWNFKKFVYVKNEKGQLEHKALIYNEELDQTFEYYFGRLLNADKYKERMRESGKRHYKENIGKYHERNKKHYIENKESYRLRGKQRRTKDRDMFLKLLPEIAEKLDKKIFKGTELKGLIYVITNLITNRKYVGQTIRDIHCRYDKDVIKGWIKDRHDYLTPQPILEEDINKYGAESFKYEIIDVAYCQFQLDKLEAYYISKFDSVNNGYNINNGKYKTKDGIEEFEEILRKQNLKIEDIFDKEVINWLRNVQ